MEQRQVGSAFNPYRQFERFDVIPDCIANLPTISPLAKLVYGHLVRRAGKNGRAFPSVESIGKHFSVSERQARRAVTELRTENLIRTVRRVNDYGQTTNLYEFIWHEWMEWGTDMSASGRTDMSAIRDKGEEPSSNTVLEPLPANATRSQSADAARDFLRSVIQRRSGHTVSEAQIDAIVTKATVRMGRPVNASECAAVASVLPLPTGRAQAIQSAAWWVSAIGNAYGEARESAENFRPEDFMASPAPEEPDYRMAYAIDGDDPPDRLM